ncbi:MAG: biopolymer transporter ExbD [Candidatus Omnitrophica bacterium]|nr:biopolymer transporter ExbD [Candidatus Omnitrophota bacterium]
MKFPRNARIFRGQLDAAPFAGVFFLLVIFLLLNSSLVFTPGVRIQLPEADGQAMAGVAKPSTIVAMDLNGQLYYENQVIQESDLRQRLEKAVKIHHDLALVVQADKAVRLEAFFRLSKLASEVGIGEVLLAGRPPAYSGAPAPLSFPMK